MALETQLAQKQWTRVDTRDVDKTYNKFELAKLNALTPGFAWATYLEATGIDRLAGRRGRAARLLHRRRGACCRQRRCRR